MKLVLLSVVKIPPLALGTLKRGEKERNVEGLGEGGRGGGVELQSEQNATNERTGWTKMKMTEKLGRIKVISTKIKE